jgi:hypothetical protein
MEKVVGEFLQNLQQALLRRRQWIEEKRIPPLVEALRTYRALFESIVITLLKKGLLREDRYEYDGPPTEIRVPTDAEMPEPSESEEAGLRISAYCQQLDFLLERVPFTMEALDLAMLGKVMGLLTYIDWQNFGHVSPSPTTRALARAISKVRLSADSMSGKLLRESQLRSERAVREIRLRITEMAAWHREAWKAYARAGALSRVVLQGLVGRTDHEEVMGVLKSTFEREMPGVEWRPELVEEILAEEQPEDGAIRREKVLHSLELPLATVTRSEAAAARRQELMDALHALCRVREEIGRAGEVLEHNEHLLDARALTALQRLRRWLRTIAGKPVGRRYEIEVRDHAAAGPRTEIIDFRRFVGELREVRATLAGLGDEENAEHVRVDALIDEQLCEFLEWQIGQLRGLYRRIDCLTTSFRLQAERFHAPGLKSVRVELLAMENAIQRADKVRRECRQQLDQEGCDVEEEPLESLEAATTPC